MTTVTCDEDIVSLCHLNAFNIEVELGGDQSMRTVLLTQDSMIVRGL